MNTKQRVNRIIGQLRGIERMIGVERDCGEILQQISAVKKAIDGLSEEIVFSDVCRIISPDQKVKMEKMIKQVINL